MTPHDTYLQLAAIAIDFPLAHADRSRLEAHLASCQSCARRASGFRGDALALGHLPAVILPERRGSEILAAALHLGVVHHPLRLLVLAALLGLLLLGSFAVGAQLMRHPEDDLSVVVPPVPTLTPAPEASAPVRPDASAIPAPTTAPGPPDGLIAYVGVENGQRVIRTVRPDGSAARTIAEGEAPAWSPDGTMLAFQCPPSSTPADPLPGADICVANADGSGQRVVVTGAITPSWSPDGTRLLFARSVIDAGDTSVVNLDGSGERRLGAGTGSWSPDGQWILLLGASGAEPDATIVHPDGTGARQLGRCGDAAWSPDGTQLACTDLQGTEGEMRAIRIADGSIAIGFSEHAQLAGPTWLSDRRMLIVMSGTGNPAVGAGDHLYLVDFQTDETRSLLEEAATVTSVAPGGEWLAVNVGETNIRLLSLDGEARTLTTDGTSMDAKWQPSAAPAKSSPSPATPEPFSSLSFQSIRVGSEDVAWASTGTKVYRTADAGATWTEVRPPVSNASVSVAPNADTAFLVRSDPTSSVWVTRDGGRSWTEVPFPREDGPTPPGLTFVSASHGFARFQPGKGTAVHIYETTDGGRTWTGPVVRNAPEGGMPEGVNAWIAGYEKGALWLSNGKADNKPFDNRLLTSVDGGATWQDGRFPTGPQAPKNELKSVDGLWADGTGHVVLAMSLGDGPQLYVSDDGGQSWRFVRSWPSFVSGNTTIGYHVALLSGDQWILVAQDGSGSWSTLDGGSSWQRVTGAPTAVLNEVYVASADRFFAVHRCDLRRTVTSEPDAVCGWPVVDTDLLVTTDGGRTWTKVTN
jgi:TolB protein